MNSSDMKQDELLVQRKYQKEENVQRSLLEMAMKLKNKELQLPEFQRNFVWEKPQIKSWIDSIITGKAIGVIVTYQSQNEGDGKAIFLADGFQRLTSTVKFLNNPSAYFYKFGHQQAAVYCDEYSITVQHRLYENHIEAMTAFQKLNSGTALTPHEFYRGELALFPHGNIIVDKVPYIVSAIEKPFLSDRKQSRNRKSSLNRDSYALFYQYITKTQATSFWNVQMNIVKSNLKSQIVERLLEEKLRELNDDEIQNNLKSFERFLFDQSAIWTKYLKESDNTGKSISTTVTRWLMHTGIWRKNVSQSMDLYLSFLKRLFEEYRKYSSITSRIITPNTNIEDGVDTIKYASMSVNDIYSGLKDFGKAFGIPIYEVKARRPTKKAARGYNESHLKPFSTHGNGETILEPASINKSRGAKEI